MLKKNTLTPKRIIELERWLIENFSVVDKGNNELIKLLIDNKFSEDEIEYILTAYHIPLSDIQEQLNVYDNSKPRIDELKFIYDLQTKYHTDRKTIIRRIRTVRNINKYLKENSTLSFPQLNYHNMLVRDKIPDILQANGQIVLYHSASDEEYLKYLLAADSDKTGKIENANSKNEVKEMLCDKLELLKAIAEHYGFTLEEIIESADLKKQTTCSFNKRLILEKTYSKNNN